MVKMGRFSNFRINRKFFGKETSAGSILSVISAAGEFIIPLLLGISAGWLGAVITGYIILPMNAELQISVATNTAAAQSKADPDNGLADFLSGNPFSVSKFPVTGNPADGQANEASVELKISFAEAALTGTFPEIGVWMQDNANNKLDFIPIGENFDVYKLTEVLYDRAIFRDDENNDVTKFLYLVDKNAAPASPARTASPRAPAAQPAPRRQITAAGSNGQEGVISRETVNDLLMNPFDEMRKFRLRPKFEGEESLGIEVQMIQNDSILAQLGVIKNDVIKSVNGIPIKNMGDVSNAINSLMNGSRFDVEVMRENAAKNLIYVVK